MFGVYATFEEVKAYLKGKENTNFHSKDDSLIKEFCIQMSRKFEAETNRKFLPRRQTRSYDHPGQASYSPYPWGATGGASPGPIVRVSSVQHLGDTLCLDDDLLQVVTLTTQNGGVTIAAADYWLLTGESYNYPPYDRIRLKPDGTTTLFSFSGTPYQANALDGLWGYHEQWAEGWQQVDTVQDNPLTASATTLTVVDVDGEDEQGLTPRFKAQQLIRFGSSGAAEYAYVISKNVESSVNTLTIKRGVNGTTAAQQANGTAIYVYRPMDELKHAMLVLAAHAYRRKDSIGTEMDQPLASPTGVLIMPSTLPGEVKAMLAKYKREPLH